VTFEVEVIIPGFYRGATHRHRVIAPDRNIVTMAVDLPPRHLHLDRDQGLTIEWPDGRTVFYPTAWLRRMSPSADARELRKEIDRNPLTVLPSGGMTDQLRAERIEPVGNYAIRIHFNDGHRTGLYSWTYLRTIEPEVTPGDAT
jgi:DUF971 family protein